MGIRLVPTARKEKSSCELLYWVVESALNPHWHVEQAYIHLEQHWVLVSILLSSGGGTSQPLESRYLIIIFEFLPAVLIDTLESAFIFFIGFIIIFLLCDIVLILCKILYRAKPGRDDHGWRGNVRNVFPWIHHPKKPTKLYFVTIYGFCPYVCWISLSRDVSEFFHIVEA